MDGNGWVAGGCWDDITSDYGSFPKIPYVKRTSKCFIMFHWLIPNSSNVSLLFLLVKSTCPRTLTGMHIQDHPSSKFLLIPRYIYHKPNGYWNELYGKLVGATSLSIPHDFRIHWLNPWLNHHGFMAEVAILCLDVRSNIYLAAPPA